jgi:hypothetical protein
MKVERWRRSDDGAVYELHYADDPPPEAVRDEPPPSMAVVPTPEPVEPSRDRIAVPTADPWEPQPIAPSRLRAIARVLRAALMEENR